MTFFQTNFGQIWEMFGVLNPFLWHFEQLFPQKKEWGHLLERILCTSRYSITQELLQRLPEFGFSYLFMLFFGRHPQLVCECVKELNYMCHSHKKNMSCQACCMFEPNSDYIWEHNFLKLLADGQVVFSKIFNFLHYLPDGIGSKWVKWYWGTYMKNSFYNLHMLRI